MKGKQPRRASHLASRLKAFPKPAAVEQPMPGLASIPTPLASSSHASTAPARQLQEAHTSLGGTASLGSAEVSSTDVHTAANEQEQLKAASQLLDLGAASTSDTCVHYAWAPKEENSQTKRSNEVEGKTNVAGLDWPRPGSKGVCLSLPWQCMCLETLSLAMQYMSHSRMKPGSCQHAWVMPCLGFSAQLRARFQHCAAAAKLSTPHITRSLLYFPFGAYTTKQLSLGVQRLLASETGQDLMLRFPLSSPDAASSSAAEARALAASLRCSKAL